MRLAPLTWFELTWPTVVQPEALAALLRFTNSAAVRPVVLEAAGEGGLVRHRLAIPARATATLTRYAQAVVAGLAVTATERRLDLLDLAVRVRPSSRWRPLNAEQLAAPSALIASLAAAGADEFVLWQLILVDSLPSAFVPNRVEESTVAPWWQGLLRAPFGRPGTLDAASRRALHAKRSQPAWRVLGRLAVRAGTPERRQVLIRDVLAAVRMTDGPGAGWLGGREPVRRVSQARVSRWGSGVLNIDELRAVSSWPLGSTTGIPVRRRPSRLLPPAPGLGARQRVVGMSTWPGQPKAVGLAATDGLRGLHVMGPVGVGKSTLLLNLITADIRDGRGVMVIDPKGDLVDAVLARIPSERQDDVVVIDPTDKVAPVGLNPLAVHGQSAEVSADLLLDIFRRLFAGAWGPRTQDILHASLLTLARHKGLTLAALPLLLTDAGFRRRLVGTTNDPLGVGAFWSQFEAWSDSERVTYTAPALTRLRPFLFRPELRAMLGQSQPRWQLDEVFTRRRIVLADLSRGVLGAETAKLLGSLLVAELWQATLARMAIPPERRHPVFLYADEFQDYLHYGHDVEDALVLARAHGLGVVVSHQHLDQLPGSVRAAVLANARSRVLFQLGPDDARALTRDDSLLRAEDVQGLPAFEAYARLVAGGAVQPWCSIRTLPEPPASADPAALRRRSRNRFGVDRLATEAALRALIEGGGASDGDDLRPRRLRPSTGDAP